MSTQITKNGNSRMIISKIKTKNGNARLEIDSNFSEKKGYAEIVIEHDFDLDGNSGIYFTRTKTKNCSSQLDILKIDGFEDGEWTDNPTWTQVGETDTDLALEEIDTGIVHSGTYSYHWENITGGSSSDYWIRETNIAGNLTNGTYKFYCWIRKSSWSSRTAPKDATYISLLAQDNTPIINIGCSDNNIYEYYYNGNTIKTSKSFLTTEWYKYQVIYTANGTNTLSATFKVFNSSDVEQYTQTVNLDSSAPVPNKIRFYCWSDTSGSYLGPGSQYIYIDDVIYGSYLPGICSGNARIIIQNSKDTDGSAFIGGAKEIDGISDILIEDITKDIDGNAYIALPVGLDYTPPEYITFEPWDNIWALQNIKVGDTITITDSDAGLSGLYRVVGKKYTYKDGQDKLSFDVSNTSEDMITEIKKATDSTGNLTKYMQGAVNIFTINETENAEMGIYESDENTEILYLFDVWTEGCGES